MIIVQITFLIFSQSFAEDTLMNPTKGFFCHKTVTFNQISQTIKQLLFSRFSRKNLKNLRCTRP